MAPTQNDVKFTPYQPGDDEEYMSKDMVKHFRGILEKWRSQLMEEVDRTVHHMQDEAANFPDPNDRATQEEEFTLELRTRDRERKLIKKIEESLIDLEKGDYGFCESCDGHHHRAFFSVRRYTVDPRHSVCRTRLARSRFYLMYNVIERC